MHQLKENIMGQNQTGFLKLKFIKLNLRVFSEFLIENQNLCHWSSSCESTFIAGEK